MSSSKGARVKAETVGSVKISGFPHDIALFLSGLYILRPIDVKGKGVNVNRVSYKNWECLVNDYPEAQRV